jgi:hypothetical protein
MKVGKCTISKRIVQIIQVKRDKPCSLTIPIIPDKLFTSELDKLVADLEIGKGAPKTF